MGCYSSQCGAARAFRAQGSDSTERKEHREIVEDAVSKPARKAQPPGLCAWSRTWCGAQERATVAVNRESSRLRPGAQTGVPLPPYLQVFRLLPELHDVLSVQLPLPPLVVLELVLQLRLVLQPDQVHAQLLQRVQLPVLELAGGLVVPDQHGVLHLLLRPLFIQFLRAGAQVRER